MTTNQFNVTLANDSRKAEGRRLGQRGIGALQVIPNNSGHAIDDDRRFVVDVPQLFQYVSSANLANMSYTQVGSRVISESGINQSALTGALRLILKTAHAFIVGDQQENTLNTPPTEATKIVHQYLMDVFSRCHPSQVPLEPFLIGQVAAAPFPPASVVTEAVRQFLDALHPGNLYRISITSPDDTQISD